MPAYYNEIDDHAAQWLRNLIAAGHLPPGDVDERSILDIQPEDLNGYEQCHFFAGIGIWGYGLRRVGWADSSPIWTGSCPCQPFSAAGNGLGFADERHLWPAWFHLIAQREPPRIVGEQVASKDGLGWLDLVSTDLENAGYAFGAADLCAAGFPEQGGDRGGFHLRQRLYFIAIGEGVDDAAGPRHAGAQQDAEGNSRDETRVRLPRERDASERLGHPANERCGEARNEYRPGESGWSSGGRDSLGLGDGLGARLEGYAGDGDGASGRAIEDRPATAAGRGSWVADSDNRKREQQPSAGRGGIRAETPSSPEIGNGPSYCGAGIVDAGGSARGQHSVPDNDARRANANLVYCRDDRWRPVEPGALPLANAVPRSMGAMRPELLAVCNAAGFDAGDLAAARKYRTGALKAFGNALDAETVVGFLEAALPLAP